jgi:hypothetical protein
MFAVIRETTYSTDTPLAERPEFTVFQDKHASPPSKDGPRAQRISRSQAPMRLALAHRAPVATTAAAALRFPAIIN